MTCCKRSQPKTDIYSTVMALEMPCTILRRWILFGHCGPRTDLDWTLNLRKAHSANYTMRSENKDYSTLRSQWPGQPRSKTLSHLCHTLLQPQESCAQSSNQVWPRTPCLKSQVCSLPPDPPGRLHRMDHQGICKQLLELHLLWMFRGRCGRYLSKYKTFKASLNEFVQKCKKYTG